MQTELIVLARNQEPLLQETLALPGQLHAQSVRLCKDMTTLRASLEAARRCLLVAFIRSGTELNDLVSFTKLNRRRILKGEVGLLAINFVMHPDVPKILRRMGFLETLTGAHLTPTFCRLRLERRLWALQPDPENRGKAEGVLRGDDALHLVEAVEFAGDCWLLRSQADVRRIRDHWIIDLLGPGPTTGRWHREAAERWRWQPRPDSPQLGDLEGSWIFSGKRPDFSDSRWQFISLDPKLTYLREGARVGDRLWVAEDGLLRIRKNSKVGVSRWGDIYRSILNEYRVPLNPAVHKAPELSSLDYADSSSLNERLGIPIASELEADSLLKQIQPIVHPRAQLFTVIDQAVHLDSYLRELDRTAARVSLWSKGQAASFSAAVEQVDHAESRLWLGLPSPQSEGSYDAFLKAVGQNPIYGNISLPRAGLLFECPQDHLHKQGQRVRLKLPGTVYEVQRRGYFRYPIPATRLLQATWDRRLYRILDLSASGLRIEAPKSELPLFPPGPLHGTLQLAINGVRVETLGEVRWTRVEGQQVHVGMRFTSLSDEGRERINHFVLEESFEYLRQVLLQD